MIPDRGHLEALFEGAPRFLDRLVAAAPFTDEAAMFAAARTIAHAMPEADQVELIDAHPRLGAPPATVSALSFAEQGYGTTAGAGAGATSTAGGGAPATSTAGAGSHAADAVTEGDRVAAELERLNAAYEARFGFRYCVFVAGRPKAALLPGMAAALEADRASELHRALDAVVDIAIDRHAKLSAEATP